jgi:ppGpp synthetase/RelA/SpoT-type nucleotidyltranferase
LSYIETLKNNCRITGHTNTIQLKLLEDAHKLYKAGIQKYHEEHFNEPLGAKHQFFNISQHTAMELSKTSGPEMVAAALLLPVERNTIKDLDASLYSVITAYDKMMSFPVPTRADERIIKNYYKMLVADPFLEKNFSGEELLRAHFLMAGTMLSTLEKGIPVIQLFYRDPIVLSQMAHSTANLLSRFNKNYEANRLRDAALNIIRPDQYQFFASFGYKNADKIALLIQKEKIMTKLRRFCEDMLNNNQEGFSFELEGRLKSVSSIKKKWDRYLKTKHDKTQTQILDLLAFRVILHCPKGPSQIDSYLKEYGNADINDKYKISKLYDNNIKQLRSLRDLFRIHVAETEEKWALIKEGDFIFKPKDNGYQALQDTFESLLEGDERIPIEFQFVSKEMDDCNKTGTASHVKYKKGEGLNRIYKPHELAAMYKDIQCELAGNVYAFAYKTNGNGNGMEISGPFEMRPEPGDYVMPLDVLSNIDVFNVRHFKKCRPDSKEEIQVLIDERIENGDMIGGEGVTAFGSKRFKYFGTDVAKNAAQFYLDSGSMMSGDISRTKKAGNDFLDGLINSQKNGKEKGFDVIFLKNLFLDELNYEDMDMAYFYVGKNEGLRSKLKNEIGKYLLGYKFDAEKSKVTFAGHRDSLLARTIMDYLYGSKYNMMSVRQSLEGEKTIFEAALDNFSKKDFEELTGYLSRKGSVRELYDHVPEKIIRDKSLAITFSKNEPGMIYKVYSFLAKNNCYISSFNTNETIINFNETIRKPKQVADVISRFSADFVIKFPAKFDDDKYNKLLNELKNLDGAFIKTATLSVTKDVAFGN